MSTIRFSFSQKALGASCLLAFLTLSSAVPASAAMFSLVDKAVETGSPRIFVAAGTQNDTLSQEQKKVGKGAQDFVDSMATRALGFLASETTTKEEKKKEFSKLLNESFDMNTIGRFSLGRYWRASTDKQKAEYQKLFGEMVVNVYSERFLEYSGQRFETRSYRLDGTKDTIVTSFVIPESGPEIQVDWRVRYKGGDYQVVDVIVEGVSMSVTQRSDFSSVIQRGGGNIDVLLAHLRGQ